MTQRGMEDSVEKFDPYFRDRTVTFNLDNVGSHLQGISNFYAEKCFALYTK